MALARNYNEEGDPEPGSGSAAQPMRAFAPMDLDRYVPIFVDRETASTFRARPPYRRRPRSQDRGPFVANTATVNGRLLPPLRLK